MIFSRQVGLVHWSRAPDVGEGRVPGVPPSAGERQMRSWTAVWWADPLDGGTKTEIPGESAFKGIVAALVP